MNQSQILSDLSNPSSEIVRRLRRRPRCSAERLAEIAFQLHGVEPVEPRRDEYPSVVEALRDATDEAERTRH
jgi:hypothetical protein